MVMPASCDVGWDGDARILRRRSEENPTPFSFALVIAEQQHLCDKYYANSLVSCRQKKDTSFLSASSPLPCDLCFALLCFAFLCFPLLSFALPWVTCDTRPGVTCDTGAPR